MIATYPILPNLTVIQRKPTPTTLLDRNLPNTTQPHCHPTKTSSTTLLDRDLPYILPNLTVIQRKPTPTTLLDRNLPYTTQPHCNNLLIIYLLLLRVLPNVQMLTRALQYNNYLTVHTQIKKKNYIVHFVTINIEERKKIKTTATYSLYNLYNY